MPVQEGATYSSRTKDQVRRTIVAATRKQPTDVAAVCYDDHGHMLLFIGLPGASSKGHP